MLDDKGNLFIIDAVIAIILLLMVFLAFNTAISLQDAYDSDEIKNSKESQDVMELLGGKINFTDRTFLGDISTILKENKNSKKSVQEVSEMCEKEFSSLNLKNYRFSETNVLNNKILASSGDYSKAHGVSVASRNYGDYSYTLSIW